jgi:hypothetical protein
MRWPIILSRGEGRRRAGSVSSIEGRAMTVLFDLGIAFMHSATILGESGIDAVALADFVNGDHDLEVNGRYFT